MSQKVAIVCAAMAIAFTGCNKKPVKAPDESRAAKGGSTSGTKAGNAACPADMAMIPAGSFTMGCSPGDTLCRAGEEPKPARVLKQFCISTHEVTQGEYKKKMGKNPSFFKQCGVDCPVEQVNWNDAVAYCKSVGGRLPTESEWEYSARGGTNTAFYWGASIDAAYAWYVANSSEKIHPVGQLKPNAYGLYDMLGNVWEWVGGKADKDGFRQLRGGGFNNNEGLLRVSSRDRSRPDASNKYIGFRCASDARM